MSKTTDVLSELRLGDIVLVKTPGKPIGGQTEHAAMIVAIQDFAGNPELTDEQNDEKNPGAICVQVFPAIGDSRDYQAVPHAANGQGITGPDSTTWRTREEAEEDEEARRNDEQTETRTSDDYQGDIGRNADGEAKGAE